MENSEETSTKSHPKRKSLIHNQIQKIYSKPELYSPEYEQKLEEEIRERYQKFAEVKETIKDLKREMHVTKSKPVDMTLLDEKQKQFINKKPNLINSLSIVDDAVKDIELNEDTKKINYIKQRHQYKKMMLASKLLHK